MAGEGIQNLYLGSGAFGEEGLEHSVEEGMEEENRGAPEEAELEAEMARDKGIEDQFGAEGAAEDVEPGGGASEKLAEEVEERREPAPLNRGRRSDEEKIGVDGEKKGSDLPEARKKKAEAERAEGDQDAEVEAGDS